MNQKRFRLYKQPNAFLLKGVNLQFLDQIQMVHLLSRFLHHSKKDERVCYNFIFEVGLFFKLCLSIKSLNNISIYFL